MAMLAEQPWKMMKNIFLCWPPQEILEFQCIFLHSVYLFTRNNWLLKFATNWSKCFIRLFQSHRRACITSVLVRFSQWIMICVNLKIIFKVLLTKKMWYQPWSNVSQNIYHQPAQVGVMPKFVPRLPTFFF